MNKFSRILLGSAGCVLLLASSVTAEIEKVQVEFSPYAGALLVDEQLGFTERVAPLVGARLGFALSPLVSFEAQAGWSRFQSVVPGPASDRNLGLASGSFVVDLSRHARVRPFLSFGGGFAEDFTTDAAGSVSDPFGEVGGGLKIVGGNGVGIRIEARQLVMPRDGVDGTELLQNTAFGARLVLPFARQYGDTDGDGVRDNHDLCMATPSGALVNPEGCPTDSDTDGVWDGLDLCMNTPLGASVDGSGCPSDTDGDGVYDGIDVCMSTPAGALVDTHGCPTDSDGDGVVDGLDNCPDTQAGAQVDESGCQISQAEVDMLDTGRLRLKGVVFATGSAELETSSYPTLDEAGEVLSKWPQLQIEIGGHTDSRGKAEANRVLSERRAQSVADYLLWRFPQVSSTQIRVRGYGEEQPIATNSTAEGRATNRRVEFQVMNREELRQIRQ